MGKTAILESRIGDHVREGHFRIDRDTHATRAVLAGDYFEEWVYQGNVAIDGLVLRGLIDEQWPGVTAVIDGGYQAAPIASAVSRGYTDGLVARDPLRIILTDQFSNGEIELQPGFYIELGENVVAVVSRLIKPEDIARYQRLVKGYGATLIGTAAMIDRSRGSIPRETYVSLLNLSDFTYDRNDCHPCYKSEMMNVFGVPM